MAFVCTAHQRAPLFETTPGQQACFQPVGHDDSDGRTYELYISFDTAPGGIIEYSFCIVCEEINGFTYNLWDSAMVAAIINSNDRAIVLDKLIILTLAILNVCKHSSFAMHTFTPNLPPKALVKYQRIAQLFTQ